MIGNTSNHGAPQRRAPEGGGPRKIPISVLVSSRGSNLQALIDACALPDFPARIVLVLSNVAGAGALGVHRGFRHEHHEAVRHLAEVARVIDRGRRGGAAGRSRGNTVPSRAVGNASAQIGRAHV